MNPLAHGANDIQTNINAYEEAARQANIKVDEFIDAVNSGDPAKIREHTLKIQEDPAAIKQLNKRPQSVRKPFIESTQRIQAKTQSIARQKIAKELGIPENKVKFKKFTGKQVNPTAGHDWDVTVEIDGKEMPLEDEMVRTSKGAKTSKVKTKGAKTIIEESYYEAATGEKAPSPSNKQASQNYKNRAKEFAAKKHVEITSSTHAEAYEGGQEFIDNPKEYKVKDPERLSKTIEHKSDLDAKKAAEYKAKGEIGKAQISKGEQARQYTKQYKKIIEPRVKAMGGKIPPKVVEGTRILNKIGQTIPGTKTVFTPQDAEIALKKIGETTESIIKKGSALVESSEKLKPKTAAPGTGKKTYVKVAKDAATGAITAIVIFSTAEDIKQKLKEGDVKGAGKMIADNLTGGAISITKQNVEKYSDYQEMKNKVAYANKTEYEAYVLKAGLQLRENGVSKEEAEQIMDDMRRGNRNSFENKRNTLQKAGKNIFVAPPKHIDNIGGDEDITTRSADVFIAIGDGILAMPGKAKKFISEGALDVYEIAGGLTEKGVLTELYNQKVESANNLLDIVKNKYRVYTLNKEIEEQKAQKDKFEQQKKIREKLIAQGLSFEEANAIAKKAAHDGDWSAFKKARLDIQAKKDAEAMAAKAGIYPEDVIAFLHCMCRACGGSLGGFYNPKCTSDIGHGPCQCNGPLTIWKTPIPSEKKSEIVCFNQITAMNYAKNQAVFNEWHQRILNENAKSVKEELRQVYKLLQDPQTAEKAIQLFIDIRSLLHSKDTQALSNIIEPKLAQKAQSEIQKGNVEGAIKNLERKNRVAGLPDDRTYPMAVAKKWLKSWKGAKKTFFPEIRQYLKERKLTDAKNKLRILNEWMQPIGKNKESPFPPAYKDPDYLALIDMKHEKEQERKDDIKNAWSKSKAYVSQKDPKSAVEVLEEVLKKWDDKETYRTQLKNELKNRLKLLVKNAQAADIYGDKLVRKGDLSGGVEWYSKSVNIQKDLTVQRKLDALLKKISSAKELLAESRKKWISGDLEKAIETIQMSKDHDPSNKQIAKTLKAMQTQKKTMDDALTEADKRIEQKDIYGAASLLRKAGQINNKYPTYTEMLKKLDRAKNKIEEEKKVAVEKNMQERKAAAAAEKKVHEEAKQKAALAEKIRKIKQSAEARKRVKEKQGKARAAEKKIADNKQKSEAQKNVEIDSEIHNGREAEVKFMGTLSGGWSGNGTKNFKGWKTKGTFVMTISKEGKISGYYSGDDDGKLSGLVSKSGKLNIKSGGGTAGSGTWGGSIKIDKQGKLSGNGIWSADGFEGIWNGKGTGEKQGTPSPVKIITSTSFESDMSAGEFKNIVTTKITLSFWNVGNKVSGYGKAVMVYKSVASLNGASQEEQFSGTFSGGPNGIILFKDDLDFPLKVVNGQRVEAKFEGESMIFDIPDPSVFEY